MKYAAALLLGLSTACNSGGSAGNAGAGAGAGAGAANASAQANAAAPAQPSQGAAAEAEVRALLDQIYAPYATDDAPGREIASFMEPSLAGAMTASEQGIDVDPFIDAQDYEPFKPSYEAIKVTGDRAEAAVRINSLGERTIDYRLVRTPGGWKIADIRSANGNLRDAYKLPPLN